MSTQVNVAVKFRRFLAFVLCFTLVFLSNGFIFESKANSAASFSISPGYSSSSTLSSKLISITASTEAFSPGSAYPRIYKDGVLQDVTITNLESTSTKVSFKIATALQDGQTYTIGIDGPTGYKYQSAASLVVDKPVITGTSPLVSLLKGYDSQKSVTITGGCTNFSLGQTTVEVLSGSTVVSTATVTSVSGSGSTQQLAFNISTGITPGDYDLRVTTGSEVIVKLAALKVLGSQTIVLSQSSLTSSYSNGTTITVTGTNTLFDSDITTVSIIDDEGNDTEKAGTKVVNSKTSLTFPISSGLGAGTYKVQVLTTGSCEEAPTSTLVISQPTGVLKKNDKTITTLGGNYPNLSLKIEGNSTNFQSGSTQLYVFAEGSETPITGKISGSPSISGQTITFTLAGGNSALTPGNYIFKAVTGSQTAEIPFAVVAPSILKVTYNSSIVDTSGEKPKVALGYKSFTMTVSGSNTHFSNDTAVTVEDNSVSVTYTSETEISFSIPEGKTTGSYTIEIDMDGDSNTTGDILTQQFKVGSVATIEAISPNTVINSGDTVTLTVTGNNTHFNTGAPSVDIIGTDENISNIKVINDTTLTFDLSPGSISTPGTYGIQVTINNAVIAETATTSSNILTVTNSGFSNNTPVVYTSGLEFAQIILKGVNLDVSEEAEVSVQGYSVQDMDFNTENNTITFDLPDEITKQGTYTINISNDGSNYSTSIAVVESYINTFSPAYKVYGYTDRAFSISGNVTVAFETGALSSVKFKQGATTKATVSSDDITLSNNILSFDIPAGLDVGIYNIELSWESGKKITVTGSFEIKHEISALALTYNSVDAGASITTYMNKPSFLLKALGTKAQETGTVDRTAKADWTSTDENVVTVSEGTVSIVGAGTAAVTASWDDQSDTVNVTVEGPLSIEISTDSSSNVTLGSQTELIATANYADSTTQNVTSKAVWSSSNTQNAQVDSEGIVTAVGAGSAVITALFTSNSVSKSDTKSFSISDLTLTPSRVNTAALNSGTWITVSGIDTSSGVDGISVTADGASKTSTITAVTGSNHSFRFKPEVSSAGSYAIVVSKGGQNYTKTFTVAQSSITPNLSTLFEGYSSFELGITGTNVTFDSSERKPVITVDGSAISSASVNVNESLNRVIFPFPAGKAVGTHTVRLSWSTGVYAGYYLETTINVTNAIVDQVKIYKDGSEAANSIEMNVNDIVHLTLKAFDESSNDLGYITSTAVWSSGNNSVATVEEGVVTGITEGSTSITASYEGKSDSVTVVVSAESQPTPVITPSPTPAVTTPPAGGSSGESGNSGGSTGGIMLDPALPTPSPTPSPTPIPDIQKDITAVDAAKIAEKIKGLAGSKSNEIKFELNEGEKAVKELLLKEDAVNSIINANADLLVKSGSVELKVPVDIIKGMADSQVKINIISVGNEEKNNLISLIPQSSMKKLQFRSSIVDLKISSVKGTTEKSISTFGRKVKIELGIDNADTLNTKKLGIYYLDEVAKTWKYVGGKYNAATGKVGTETNHFTKFTVIEYDRTFIDVGSDSWAKEYIELLAARHITDGIDENNFDPGGVVTRAQFATFLVKALGIETQAYRGKFSDVPSGKWFTLYVEAAERAGLVSGYGNGGFNPDANITREQMAAMVMNAYKYAVKADIAVEAGKSTAKFNDEDTISSWAKDSVYAAQAKGIINGMPGNVYNPSDNAKREQAARVIIGLLELLGEI
jgi:hypothetical protein